MDKRQWPMFVTRDEILTLLSALNRAAQSCNRAAKRKGLNPIEKRGLTRNASHFRELHDDLKVRGFIGEKVTYG